MLTLYPWLHVVIDIEWGTKIHINILVVMNEFWSCSLILVPTILASFQRPTFTSWGLSGCYFHNFTVHIVAQMMSIKNINDIMHSCVWPLLQHAEGFYRDEVDEFHTQKEKVSPCTFCVRVCVYIHWLLRKSNIFGLVVVVFCKTIPSPPLSPLLPSSLPPPSLPFSLPLPPKACNTTILERYGQQS